MAKISLNLNLDLPGESGANGGEDLAVVLEWLIRVAPRAPEETLRWFVGDGPQPTWPVLYELTDVLERAFPAQVVDAVGDVGMAGAVVDRSQAASAEDLWNRLRSCRDACMAAIQMSVEDRPAGLTAVVEGDFLELFPTTHGGPRSGAKWTGGETYLHLEPVSAKPLRSWKVTSSEPFTVNLQRPDSAGRAVNVSVHDHAKEQLLGAATITSASNREFVIEGADIDLEGEGRIDHVMATIRPDGDRLSVKVKLKAKPKRRWLGALSNGWILARRPIQKRMERSANPRVHAIMTSPEWVNVVTVARRDRAT